VVFALENTTLYGIPKEKYPCDGDKAEKTKNWQKIPLLSTNQKTEFIYKVELYTK